jgi:hypothetical protein
MTIHLCRDFLTDATASCPGTNMYALAMFLEHVGGFGVIGQTNFDILGSGSTGYGSNASINSGGLGTYEVAFPASEYQVSSADVGRILALQSRLYPLANSGLFRVSSVDIPNNGVVIDYRSTSAPPIESGIPWRMFINEAVFATYWQTGSNGGGLYGGYNLNTASLSNNSRIVLQSVDDSSWEVRLCLESAHDISGAVPSGFSVAPGFGGNPSGDFGPYSIQGPGFGQLLHLHAAAWYNTTASQYQGMTVGLTPALGAQAQWRISMIVDSHSGTCGMINHNVNLPVLVNSGSGWCVFGLSADETEFPAQNNLSDPTINVQRLFVVGSSNPHSNLSWQSQFHKDNVTQVVGWSKLGFPCAGVLSLYSDISNPSNSHVRYASGSTDNVWSSQTVLMDAEILLGTVDVTVSASAGPSLFPFTPRRLGRLPFFMQGRANYPNWSMTSDGNWYHTEDGIFMPWSGPEPTDASVNPNTALANSGSNELQQGLDPLGAFLPGSDPPAPPVIPVVQDVDSTRYRKTYSYFRQVPVIVGVQKGGSNPNG